MPLILSAAPSSPAHQQIPKQAGREDHIKTAKQTLMKRGTSVELTGGQNIQAEIALTADIFPEIKTAK